jgi:hypothetical protein
VFSLPFLGKPESLSMLPSHSLILCEPFDLSINHLIVN